jgi:hypothetical protein
MNEEELNITRFCRAHALLVPSRGGPVGARISIGEPLSKTSRSID